MSVITNPYDIGQIIAPMKRPDTRLWQALDTLNLGVTDINAIVAAIEAYAYYERITLRLPLTGSTDLLQYVVKMPVDANNVAIATRLNITRMLITSQAVPGSDDVLDLLVSKDLGNSFNSCLKPSGGSIVYNKGTLPMGQTLISYGIGQFSIGQFFDNDFLTVSLLSGSITDGLTIDLIGNYTNN